MPVVVKWRFFDPIVSEGYVFEINPNDGGSPSRKKSVTYQNTAAPGGRTLVFEGRDETQAMSFSGVLLSREQLAALERWFDKRHQILVTDDLERQFWIYITAFTPKRERAVSHPWKHTYQVEAVIVDWELA